MSKLTGVRLECSDSHHCNTQHLSNFSLGIQYGDDMPPTPCDCQCHLNEDNIHGNASRARQNTKVKIGDTNA